MPPWLNGSTVSSGAPCQPTHAPSVLVIMGASAVTRPPGERRQPSSPPLSSGAQRSTGSRLDTTMKSYCALAVSPVPLALRAPFWIGSACPLLALVPPGVARGSQSTLAGRNLPGYSSVGRLQRNLKAQALSFLP